MRILTGITLLLIGLFALVAWGAASHAHVNFDPTKGDDWLLLAIVIIPTFFGLTLMFYPWLKRRKRK